jgi:hypothetical protein
MSWDRISIIGLAGRAGSGKDTAAQFILDEHPNWQRVAFADPLRRIAADLYDLDPEQMSDRGLKEQELPEWGLSPRQILQRLGTEVVRSVHPQTWILYALRTISESDADGFVIPDTRFANEVELIRNLGGVIWWVDRDTDAVCAHASEKELTAGDCDAVIPNTGSLDDLRAAVRGQLIETA